MYSLRCATCSYYDAESDWCDNDENCHEPPIAGMELTNERRAFLDKLHEVTVQLAKHMKEHPEYKDENDFGKRGKETYCYIEPRDDRFKAGREKDMVSNNFSELTTFLPPFFNSTSTTGREWTDSRKNHQKPSLADESDDPEDRENMVKYLERRISNLENKVEYYEGSNKRTIETANELNTRIRTLSAKLNTATAECNFQEIEIKALKKHIANLMKVGTFPWSSGIPQKGDSDERFNAIEYVSNDELIEHKANHPANQGLTPETMDDRFTQIEIVSHITPVKQNPNRKNQNQNHNKKRKNFKR